MSAPPDLSRSPLGRNKALGRAIRQDGIETLGISTQQLVEWAAAQDSWAACAELVDYFKDEMYLNILALRTWSTEIHFFLHPRDPKKPGAPETPDPLKLDPEDFEFFLAQHKRAQQAAGEKAAGELQKAVEVMRAEACDFHDRYVISINALLAGIAKDRGDEGVLSCYEHCWKKIWQPRYAKWWEWSPIERVQICTEAMRGHLSGAKRRGDVGLREEDDRYVMTLDPCGSCGALRRAGTKTGMLNMPGWCNAEPHDWTFGRRGMSWFALHGPVSMMYFPLREGKPPIRAHVHCDEQGPCEWHIYKAPELVRGEHWKAMGFQAPQSDENVAPS